jgi:penicillin-binding protein 1B
MTYNLTLKLFSPVQQKLSLMFLTHFKRWILVAFIIFIPLFAVYLNFLDQKIRQKFEGKRWDIPAKVYANPLDLYVGYALAATEFKDLLQQLHYRRDASLSSEGTYQVQGQTINLKTRSFTFWDGTQESLHLKIDFSDTAISKITDIDHAQNLPVARMDPVQIGSFYPKLKEDRILIKLKDAPLFLKQGLLATEDRDFYQHHGVSIRGLARAILANVRAGGLVQGGSTITQQLVKNFYLTSERTLKRKVNELFMAILLDAHYSKDEILEAYFNEIYLGQDGASSVNGFGLASEFYFGQPLKSLALPQIVGLVALVRGPSYYDPRRYPDRSLERRNLVLDKMLEQGYITEQQATEAKQQTLGVIANAHRSVNRYPAFLDLVKRQLGTDYKEQDLTTEGLKIFTTLDTQIQNAAEKTAAKKLAALEKGRKSKDLETAIIVTRREGGEIVALVGGKNSSEPGFNRALDALRPIGSLIKPAVYLTALSNPEQYTINTLVQDNAIQVDNDGAHWSPKNYDHQEHGFVPLHTALAHSYNLATVRIGMDVGLKAVANTLLNLGVTREVELLPSLLLGASPLTPLEVTQMYQTLADDGFVTPLKAIREVVTGDGKQLQRYGVDTKQSIDPAPVYLTNTILQEVVSNGTAKAAYNVLPRKLNLAGKTGTSNDAKDSWFAGFSGDYLSVVWIGRDDNKPMGLTGATGALQVWIGVMKQIADKAVDLIAPENIERVSIDSTNGLRANAGCPTARSSPYITGSAPTDSSPCTAPTVDETSDSITDPADENSVEAAPNTENSDDSVNPDSEPVAPPSAPTKSWFNNLF